MKNQTMARQGVLRSRFRASVVAFFAMLLLVATSTAAFGIAATQSDAQSGEPAAEVESVPQVAAGVPGPEPEPEAEPLEAFEVLEPLAEDELDAVTPFGITWNGPVWTFPDRYNSTRYGPLAMRVPNASSDLSWNRELTVITGVGESQEGPNGPTAGQLVPTTTRVTAGAYEGKDGYGAPEWNKGEPLIWELFSPNPARQIRLLSEVTVKGTTYAPGTLCLSAGAPDDVQQTKPVTVKACSDATERWIMESTPAKCYDPVSGPQAGNNCWSWQIRTVSAGQNCGLHLDLGRTGDFEHGVGLTCGGHGADGSALFPGGLGPKPPETADVTVQKTVRAGDVGQFGSRTTARPGTILTYRLVFSNPTSVEKTISFTDDMRDVLESGTYKGVLANPNNLDVMHVVGQYSRITGTLEPGATAILTYQVAVKSNAQRGDTLTNKVSKGTLPPADKPTKETCDDSAGDCTVTVIISTNNSALTIYERVIGSEETIPANPTAVQLDSISSLAGGWEYTVTPTGSLKLAQGVPPIQTTAASGPSFGTVSYEFTGSGLANMEPTDKPGYQQVLVGGETPGVSCVDATTGDPVFNDYFNGKVRIGLNSGGLVECTFYHQADPASELFVSKQIEKVVAVDAHGRQDLDNPTSATVLTAGDKVTYAITVRNVGDAEGTTVLTEKVPEGTTYVGGAAEGWTYDSALEVYTKEVTVAKHGSEIVEFTVRVDDPVDNALRKITNTVETTAGICTSCTAENALMGLWSLKKSVTVDGNAPVGGIVEPGDILTYTVTAAVNQSEVKDLVLTDDLSDVLGPSGSPKAEFVTGSAKLVVDGGAPQDVDDPTGNTLSARTSGPVGAGKTIVLTYQVKIKDDAWSSKFTNIVTGESSSEDADCGTDDQDCTVTVNTQHSIQIYKVAENSEGQIVGLPGTEWGLWDSANGGTKVASAVAMEQSGTVIEGLFTVDNIPTGTYYVEESVGPEGFELLAQRVQVVIDSDGKVSLGSYGVSSNTVLVKDAPGRAGAQTLKVFDVPRVELPESGGTGWTVATITAWALLGTASVLVARRYNSRQTGGRHAS